MTFLEVSFHLTFELQWTFPAFCACRWISLKFLGDSGALLSKQTFQLRRHELFPSSWWKTTDPLNREPVENPTASNGWTRLSQLSTLSGPWCFQFPNKIWQSGTPKYYTSGILESWFQTWGTGRSFFGWRSLKSAIHIIHSWCNLSINTCPLSEGSETTQSDSTRQFSTCQGM